MLPTSLLKLTQELLSETAQIPEERQILLKKLSQYIIDKRSKNLPIAITVICTHNSRRSHIGQLWLQVAAIYFGIENFASYSGGTEATAFNHRSVAALQRAGFPLTKVSEGENPHYELAIGVERLPLFSKRFDESPNPTEGFAAIMVCTEADADCPIVAGADARFAIPYHDPKAFDDTAEEVTAYDERVRQIGREMLFAMNV